MTKTTITLDSKAQVHGNGKNLYAASLSNIDDEFGDSIVTLIKADSEDEIADDVFSKYGDDMDRDEFFENWQIAITLIGKVS